MLPRKCRVAVVMKVGAFGLGHRWPSTGVKRPLPRKPRKKSGKGFRGLPAPGSKKLEREHKGSHTPTDKVSMAGWGMPKRRIVLRTRKMPTRSFGPFLPKTSTSLHCQLRSSCPAHSTSREYPRETLVNKLAIRPPGHRPQFPKLIAIKYTKRRKKVGFRGYGKK